MSCIKCITALAQWPRSAREDRRNSTDTLTLAAGVGAASSAGTGGVASTCALHRGDPACYRMTPSSSGASSASVHYRIHGTWHWHWHTPSTAERKIRDPSDSIFSSTLWAQISSAVQAEKTRFHLLFYYFVQVYSPASCLHGETGLKDWKVVVTRSSNVPCCCENLCTIHATGFRFQDRCVQFVSSYWRITFKRDTLTWMKAKMLNPPH